MSLLKRPPLVDRDDEMAALLAMLDGDIEERIILICAESGWGKTALLAEFERRRPKAGWRCARVPLKGDGLAEMLSRLCETLGWEYFPQFAAAVQQMTQGDFPSTSESPLATAQRALALLEKQAAGYTSLTIPPHLQIELEDKRKEVAQLTAATARPEPSKDLRVSPYQINKALSSPDEQTHKAQCAALTSAFFADARTLGPTLFIFDTFERGDATVQTWLAEAFLPRVQRAEQLYIVLAGQKVPERAPDWECCKLPLGPIAPEHWHTYAEALGVTISLELINCCCQNCKGHPLSIAQVLEVFVPGGWAR